jgi:UDP-N-acetylglucosamine diphosphorylase / glucose-1-phosphate thymidylyltransferase / UDP-N-acetylgalactosamine diphosphorylase / glucosamine-1-phosphate N-acetyltransferase / galactosamine-1-phosphate N-acetyltransferase
MYLCLFEDSRVAHLDPLTLTRPPYDLRLGIRTLLQKAIEAFDGNASLLLHTRPHLAAVTANEHDALVNHIPDGLDVLFVNGRLVVEEGELLERLKAASRNGEPGRVFVQGDVVVAAYVPGADKRFVASPALGRELFDGLAEETVEGARLIEGLWDLVENTPQAVVTDYETLSKGFNMYERTGTTIHESAVLVEPEQIYIAPGARIHPGAVLNAEDGPIFVDREAVVMDGAVIRGPSSIGAKATVKVHADLQACVIGPVCKAAGEMHNVTLHSFTNKAHAGFIGHSYFGSWVNIGAGTISSNLRNDYGTVSIYDAALNDYVDTGRQFAGLIMADHAKSGINAMFNTGSVVGVSCNVFGTGFPERYLPSFTWVDAGNGFTTFRFDKALEVARAVMQRRDITLSEDDERMLRDVFEMSAPEREAAE